MHCGTFRRAIRSRYVPGDLPRPRVPSTPSTFSTAMLDCFASLGVDSYASAYARFAVHDGSQYKDPFSDNAGTFAFNAMLTRIAALHEAQAALAADEPLQVESIAVADSLAE